MFCCCSSFSLVIYFAGLWPTLNIKYDEERKKGVPYSKAAMKSLLIPFIFMIIYIAFLLFLYASIFGVAYFAPELNDRFTLLGLLFSGIIDMICAIVPFFVLTIHAFSIAKKDQKRQIELDAMPGLIQRFIDSHGYASPQDLISYCMNSPDFESSRGIDYINPEYERQKEIKEQTKSNDPINVPHYIGLADYIPIPYEEIVSKKAKEQLREIIPQKHMFDVETLYNSATAFHSYYITEKSFANVAYDIINSEFSDKLDTISKNDGTKMFKSKLSPEEFECSTGYKSNIVEGEIIEINLDD